MISKDSIKKVLIESLAVSREKYQREYVTYHVKTFYFFCERLAQHPAGVVLSSADLRKYIHAQLREHKILVGPKFNPEGFFGKAWTEWKDSSKNQTNFKNEYYEVLNQIGSEPYSYQIKPECWESVVEIFAEFRSSKGGN